LEELLSAAEAGEIPAAAELHGRLTDLLLRSAPAAGTPLQAQSAEDAAVPLEAAPQEEPPEPAPPAGPVAGEDAVQGAEDSPVETPAAPAFTPEDPPEAVETGRFVPSSAFASENLLAGEGPSAPPGAAGAPEEPEGP